MCILEPKWTSIWFPFFKLLVQNLFVIQSLMSKGTKFQILGPRYDNVSVTYNSAFTLCEWKLTFQHGLFGTAASLISFHIIFGAIRCLTLYISRASFWMFPWWIVKELFSWRSLYKKEVLSLWTKRTALFWRLFILLFSFRLWNIQTKGQYAKREEKTHSL